jgi:hypothetical protein
MIEQTTIQELWGGVMWGDCIGRFHRGWTPSVMDQALGDDFFKTFVVPGESTMNWLPKFRAIEPVQRRAFVELGLLGHASQLCLFTASILSDANGRTLRAGWEAAMSRDAFRTPNSELVETMYRMCRGDQKVDPRFAHLFFPSILYLCLNRSAHCPADEIEMFRPFISSFQSVISVLKQLPNGQVVGSLIEASLASLFDENTVHDDSIDAVELSQLMQVAESPARLWVEARPMLTEIPYIGPVIGLLGTIKFGGAQIVAWNRLRAPEALETLVSNRPINFETRLEKERDLSQAEAVTRESYLSERRAKIGSKYR